METQLIIYVVLENNRSERAMRFIIRGFTPTGTMDPAGLCQGLTRWATQLGAQVFEECPVTDIKTQETLLGGRRVTEVHTPRGVIKTNAVVNATGNTRSKF